MRVGPLRGASASGGTVGQPACRLKWLCPVLFIPRLFQPAAPEFVDFRPEIRLRSLACRSMTLFVHLIFVLALLCYLPYSKSGHLLYRFSAIVHAKRTGGYPE